MIDKSDTAFIEGNTVRICMDVESYTESQSKKLVSAAKKGGCTEVFFDDDCLHFVLDKTDNLLDLLEYNGCDIRELV